MSQTQSEGLASPYAGEPAAGLQNDASRRRPLSIKSIRKSMVAPLEVVSPTSNSDAAFQKSQKKKPSMIGLFRTQEPSSLALREYEQMLKKQQNKGKGKLSAVGMPMTAAAKLPAHVPKVNSKWDGLPAKNNRDKAKEKNLDWARARSDTGLRSPGSSHSSLQFITSPFSPRSLREWHDAGSTSGGIEGRETASGQSYPNSVVRSNASTLSSASAPSAYVSVQDFGLPETRPSQQPTIKDQKPEARQDVIAVMSISSSKNSPDSVAGDLQFSTSFPFPNPSSDPASPPVLESPAHNSIVPGSVEAHTPDSLPLAGSAPQTDHDERSGKIFSKLRSKRMFSGTRTIDRTK